MSVVFACIAPHGGHLLLGENAPGPVPQCRQAMAYLRESLRAAKPDCVAILTPHGVALEGTITLGVTATGYGELDALNVSIETDLDLAAAWAYRATEKEVPVTPLAARVPEGALPLDWGVTIPLALLTPTPDTLPTVVACPDRSVPRAQLVDWGEALVEAAEELGRRVALIVSADQGHGHAADGPYGFTPASADYDAAMQAAIEADDLTRLLTWPEDWPEAAMADSYWQTLSLIGIQKRVPLRARLLSYEVDHYFGLLCAEFLPER
ncbi:MAG: extradiol ring-cleavage dioxygenase [Armatimonadota bacterium]|nr:extradiol ring-cleavage dioxygenase [Armatimonadota bacterium]